MCYSVYISTDSSEDLSKRNSELVRFEKVTNTNDDICTKLLDFPNRWYVGSKSGCSCTFRHLLSIELGFSEPVDWYKEEQDAINATSELYSALALPLNNQELAQLLAISPEHLCRVLKGMEEKGLLRRTHGTVIVTNPSGFRRK